jgi:replicative DNA helicase
MKKSNQKDFGKIPPQAIEFEKAVLGVLMINKNVIHSIIDTLSDSDFYNDSHGKIYKAIVELSQQHNPIDIHTVSQQLKTNGDIDSIGGPFYLTQLTNEIASAAHIEFHAGIIKQESIKRKLINIGADIQRLAFDSNEDVADLLEYAEAKILSVKPKQSTDK